MRGGCLTVGTTAVAVPEGITPAEGMRLLARAANAGAIYYGFDAAVTTDTGILVPRGDFGVTTPRTVPAAHFTAGGSIYVVADQAGQKLEWEIA